MIHSVIMVILRIIYHFTIRKHSVLLSTDPPYIDHRMSVVHGNEGTVVSIPCIVDANPSTSSMITWSTHNQSRITTDETFSIELTGPSDNKPERRESRISFTVHRALFGNYTCTARNTIGSDSSVIQLSGHCKESC